MILCVRHSSITLPIFTVESQTVKSRMLVNEFQLYKVIYDHLEPEYQNVFALQKRDVDRLLQGCLLLNKLQRQILNYQIQIVQILLRQKIQLVQICRNLWKISTMQFRNTQKTINSFQTTLKFNRIREHWANAQSDVEGHFQRGSLESRIAG
ncbi:Hypothetical_protein [Hexamita inflata]|uniref:Hypothetical_protein n=1 Tax=Hexamita inflata TaxID=28002 RepID=A0ABP1KPX2_9EUKA